MTSDARPTPGDCPTDAALTSFLRGDLPPDEIDQVARHVEGCARCEGALQRLEAGTDGDPVAAALRGAPASAAGPGLGVGAVVGGRYVLEEPIGQGGMGTVYRARQTEPVRRDVAVKLIRPGMGSEQVLARFEAERQALAVMDHPNIAKVFDAGALGDGRPYFVMELVRGVPITAYCDDKHLPLRERLELFVPVCRAIQHAHQKGVIHRDIKPSNVLVSEVDGRAVPKVIDFGIAKATHGPLTERTLVTGLGAIVGTPEYMAPEQAAADGLDVDTRADVYALGVLLYELLTGSTPLTRQRVGRAALLEVLRLVREEEPPTPSSRLAGAETLPSIAANRRVEPRRLAAMIRGELDWVVMKALEKDRARRYESASGLAGDVERYLADEVVEARPPSRRYRVEKFVRRNRGAVSVAVGFVLLLATATGVSTWLAVRAIAAEKKAVENFEDAKEQRARAEGLLELARGAIDQFGRRTANDNRLRGLPGVQRALLADTDEYHEQLNATYPGDPRLAGDRARTRAYLGYIETEGGSRSAAREHLGAARAAQEELLAKEPGNRTYRNDLVATRTYLGRLATVSKDPAGAFEHFDRAIALGEELLREVPANTSVRMELSGAYQMAGAARFDAQQHSAARALYERSRELESDLIRTDGASREHREGFAVALNGLGLACFRQSPRDLPAARRALEQARAIYTELAAAEPDAFEYQYRAAAALNNLVIVARAEGTVPADKIRLQFFEVIGTYERLTARSGAHRYRQALAGAYDELASEGRVAGDPAGALKWANKAWAVVEGLRTGDPASPDLQNLIRNVQWNRAEVLAALGRSNEALPVWDELLAMQHTEGTRNELRSQHAVSLAAVGQRADASTEVTALTAPPEAARLLFFRGAEALAEASATARRDATIPALARSFWAEVYAARAIELLTRSRDMGYLVTRGGKRELATSPYLAPLRERPGFKRIAAAPAPLPVPKLEVAPPPRERPLMGGS
ncbi:protein kinase [Gemmata sp. G18]|uniref:Protein kinase n=1 Tax=Gemmata palustris TaxID=2822762 RepID=A0ABS5BUF8_9BACT|nr:serine/threonine-protein kinase [Gemmata palustris]MBP3957359.1 protein kinase [Gemmata palustris]